MPAAEAAAAPPAGPVETKPEPAPPAPVESPPAPPPRSTPRSEPLQQAIAHLNQIVSALREVLTDLEDVAELLEIAETQKLDDEKEIETLRRTLSQLQRAREHVRPRPDRPTAAMPTSGSPHTIPTRR